MQNGTCRRGDACPFAHGVFESWLHPSRYRTQVGARLPILAASVVCESVLITSRATNLACLIRRGFAAVMRYMLLRGLCIACMRLSCDIGCFVSTQPTSQVKVWPRKGLPSHLHYAEGGLSCSAAQMGSHADAESASLRIRTLSSENQRMTLLCLQRSCRRSPLPVNTPSLNHQLEHAQEFCSTGIPCGSRLLSANVHMRCQPRDQSQHAAQHASHCCPCRGMATPLSRAGMDMQVQILTSRSLLKQQ